MHKCPKDRHGVPSPLKTSSGQKPHRTLLWVLSLLLLSYVTLCKQERGVKNVLQWPTWLASELNERKQVKGQAQNPCSGKQTVFCTPALDLVFSLFSVSILPGLSSGLRHPVLVSKKHVTLRLPAATWLSTPALLPPMPAGSPASSRTLGGSWDPNPVLLHPRTMLWVQSTFFWLVFVWYIFFDSFPFNFTFKVVLL